MKDVYEGIMQGLKEFAEMSGVNNFSDIRERVEKSYGLTESLNESADPEQAYSSALGEIEKKLAEIKLSLRMMYRLQKEVEVTWDDVGTLNSIKEKLTNAKEETERFSDYIRILL